MFVQSSSEKPIFDIPTFSDRRYRTLQAIAYYPGKTVLRAFVTETQKTVGLGVFPSATNDAEQAWILAAISSLRKISHPLLATITDINTTLKGQPFFAYTVHETSFARACTPARMRDIQIFIPIAVQLLRGLQVIHESGHLYSPIHTDSITMPSPHELHAIIHYDAWTPTIALRLGQSSPRGLALHELRHSPALRMYAPEYFTGNMPDARADLYALGICLHEAISGEKTTSDTPDEIFRSGGIHSLDPIQKFAPRFPDALADWLHTLLAPQRAQRFISAKEALRALSALGFISSTDYSDLADTRLFSHHSTQPIGRERALQAVKISRHELGAPRLIELSGEPGTGKTTLLQRIQTDCVRDGKKALLMHGSEFNSSEWGIPSFADIDILLLDDIEKAKPEGNSTLKYIMSRNAHLLIFASHRTQLPFAVRRDDVQMLVHWTEQQTRQYCTEVLGIGNYDLFAKALHKRSAGNPYMTLFLLREALNDNILRYEHNEWRVVNVDEFASRSVVFPQMYLRDHIAQLPAEERDLLILLWLAGNPLPAFIPTETLNCSGRAVIRMAQSLAYKGYVSVHNFAIDLAHDIIRDALQFVVKGEFKSRAEEIAHSLKRTIETLNNPSDFQDNQQGQVLSIEDKTSDLNSHQIDTKQEVFSDDIEKNIPQAASEEAEILEASFEVFTESRVHSTITTNNVEVEMIGSGNMEISADVEVSDANENKTLSSDSELYTIQHRVIPTTIAKEETALQISSPLLEQGIFVGKSDTLNKLRTQIERFSTLDIPVLLTGAFGTKKEHVASALHHLSNRSTLAIRQFVCSDYSTEELEAELFGSSGILLANTAVHTQIGTVFLDDITAMDATLQSKIARIIRRSYTNDTLDQSIARFIIGMNQSPEEAMANGSLLQELYYVASSARIALPSLNERGADIPALAMMYMQSLNPLLQTTFTGFTQRALQYLMQRPWSGNLLELEHTIRKAMLESHDDSSVLSHTAFFQQASQHQIPSSASNLLMQQPLFSSPSLAATNSSDTSIATINDLQKEHILRVLEQTGNNKSEASIILGIKRTTLIARMKKLGIMP